MTHQLDLAKRRSLRSQVTRLVNEGQNLVDKEDHSEAEKSRMQALPVILTNLNQELENLSFSVYEYLVTLEGSQGGLDTTSKQDAEVEKIYEYKYKAEEAIETLKARYVSIITPAQTSTPVATTSFGGNITETGTKIKAMEIPKFDGDPLKWTNFIQTFDDLVGNVNSLS